MIGDGREADPEVKNLNAEYVRLMTEKKQTLAEYREAGDYVREYIIVQGIYRFPL